DLPIFGIAVIIIIIGNGVLRDFGRLRLFRLDFVGEIFFLFVSQFPHTEKLVEGEEFHNNYIFIYKNIQGPQQKRKEEVVMYIKIFILFSNSIYVPQRSNLWNY